MSNTEIVSFYLKITFILIKMNSLFFIQKQYYEYTYIVLLMDMRYSYLKNIYMRIRYQRISELIPIIFNMQITNLDFEASKLYIVLKPTRVR